MERVREKNFGRTNHSLNSGKQTAQVGGSLRNSALLVAKVQKIRWHTTFSYILV